MSITAKRYIRWLRQSNYQGDYIEGAFQLFIDNKINAEELNEILKRENYILPESFFELNRFEQKKYRQYCKYTYEFIDDEFKEDDYTIFNRAFFDDLVKKAKADKAKHSTEILINYLLSLGELNYFFFGCEFIDLKKTSLINLPGMSAYLKNKFSINTLYDLFVNLLPFKQKNNNLRQEVINHLRTNSLFNINVLDELFFFFLVMESFLSGLSRKERNTLRAKCLIIDKKYLHEDEYMPDSNKAKRIYIKDYIGKECSLLFETYPSIFDSNYKGVNNTFLTKEVIKSFGPNGYVVLYDLIRREYNGSL